MTGADIRRFEEFTETATTAVVGVHRDQAELRERLAKTEQSIAEARQAQTRLIERLDAMEESMRTQGRPKMPAVISLGMSAVALVLGIVAVIAGVL